MANPTTKYYPDTDTLYVSLCDTPATHALSYCNDRVVIHYSDTDQPVAITVERPTLRSET